MCIRSRIESTPVRHHNSVLEHFSAFLKIWPSIHAASSVLGVWQPQNVLSLHITSRITLNLSLNALVLICSKYFKYLFAVHVLVSLKTMWSLSWRFIWNAFRLKSSWICSWGKIFISYCGSPWYFKYLIFCVANWYGSCRRRN